MTFDKGYPPNSAIVGTVREWLEDHPGATLDEVAAGVMPGKITAVARVGEVLRCLRGRCQARRDGERWYAAS